MESDNFRECARQTPSPPEKGHPQISVAHCQALDNFSWQYTEDKAVIFTLFDHFTESINVGHLMVFTENDKIPRQDWGGAATFNYISKIVTYLLSFCPKGYYFTCTING